MKVCFWGNITGALIGKTEGGGELQIAFIAKALAASGNEVIIVDFEVNEDFITTDGIKIKSIRNWNKGIRILRTVTHRIPSLFKALAEQNADVYYCRIRDFRHIIAYRVARKLNSKFVLHMASDLDAMNLRSRLRSYYFYNRTTLWLFFSGILLEIIQPWLLRHADLVLVQHSGQKKILVQKNIKPVVFYNMIDLSKIPAGKSYPHSDFVYVGWLDRRKGFPELFKLIELSPTHTFKIIGPPRDEIGLHYYEKLKSFRNVKLLGICSHSKTIDEISKSKALISTSRMEGFPNVFIEAWACGIPVYSLNVDPGNIIEKEGLGVFANGNFDILKTALDEHFDQPGFAMKAKKYVEKYHAINKSKVEEINSIFKEVYDRK
ncbi:MAG TPA: glycosyltransferase family 4 protein [Bacteroidales bacterium]|nr:glycosyltransferase family 4 protein [Bacteroidales bacterium]